MKYAFTFLLTFALATVWAQKQAQSPKKLASAKSNTPVGTYRLSENSDVVYAEHDNMPILLPQAPEQMPMPNIKAGRDSVQVKPLPNPMYPRRKVLPRKP